MPQSDKPLVISAPEPRTLDLIFAPRALAAFRSRYRVVETAADALADLPDDVLGQARYIVGQPPIQQGTLERLEALRCVFNVESNLIDNMPYETLFSRGIHVVTTGLVFAEPVAELGLAMALNLARDIVDADLAFRPDRQLADGEVVDGGQWRLKTVLTPGHAANHAAFALEGTGILFSADHVMGWSTTIVAPPDGSMADYMASLDKLIGRGDRLLLPGHGGPVSRPATFMRGLKAHRKMRERAILERIRLGDRTVRAMVEAIYRGTDPRLHGAAALSVLAHLEDLVARGLVHTEGSPAIEAIYTPAA